MTDIAEDDFGSFSLFWLTRSLWVTFQNPILIQQRRLFLCLKLWAIIIFAIANVSLSDLSRVKTLS
jgi:hypothetical protein